MIGELGRDTTIWRAQYHLEDLVDHTGNALTLVNVGSVTFTTGKFGLAADLGSSAGHSKYLTNSSVWTTALPTQVTYMAWVKPTTMIASGTQFLIDGNTGTSGCNYSLRYDYNAGTPRLQAFVDLTSDAIANYNITMDTNEWHHVALVKVNTLTVKLFVDGALASTATGSGTETTLGPANSFMIGNSIGSGLAGFPGKIDEVAVSTTTAVSDKYIWDYYHSTKQVYG